MGDEQIGKRITELRKRRGLAQAQLVLPGVLSASLVSLIESGRRRPSRAALEHIAALLDTTVEFLTTGETPAGWLEIERRIAFAELAVHHGSAEQALAELATAIPADCPAELRTQADLVRARAWESLGSLDAAIEAYEGLWWAAEPDTAEWAERAVDIMRCYRLSGDFDYAIAVGERALEAFERLDLEWTDAALRLGVSLFGSHEQRGDLTRARLLGERFLGLAEDHGTPLARGSAYWNASRVAWASGRTNDARRLLHRALAVFGEADHERNLAELRATYALLLLTSEPADPHQARELLLTATDRLDQVGSPIIRSAARQAMTVACLQLDDLDEAARWAAEAEELATGSPLEEARARLAVASVLTAQSQADTAALKLAEAEAALSQAAPPSREIGLAWRRLAGQYADLGDQAGELRALRAGMSAAGFGEPRTHSAVRRADRPA
ncbi:helix-turn-helix transcriptional regulator [Hamadaea sp. NPDC051192]|uniref:helix-turn-helix transcriptional regulator n=1 Tax=Hamadaea sp. NPDC051192 TaxID=3154940 RepID=UPI00342182FA